MNKINLCKDILHELNYAGYLKDDTFFKVIVGDIYLKIKEEDSVRCRQILTNEQNFHFDLFILCTDIFNL